jgi:P-type Cu2+ transporter
MSTHLSTTQLNAASSNADQYSERNSAVNGRKNAAPWQSFDEDAKWKGFSQKAANGYWVSRFKVQGMHCSSCATKVENALRQIPGVLNVDIDAMTARLRLTWDQGRVKPSQWLTAASKTGYALLPIQGTDALEQARLDKRAMLWRWLVAGFCMMQVMMYAWPNYSAAPGDIDATSDRLLRWASLLLTLPVIFFSCSPFFRAAWNDVRHGRISMDLPVSLGIGLSFVVSSAAVLDPSSIWGSALYFDSLTMLVFFLLTGRWLEMRLKQKVAGQLEAGADLIPLSAERVFGTNSTSTVPAQSLSPGDVIYVRIGESFAADGIITVGQSEAEESLLTGEAIPVAKALGDSVYAGTTNLASPLHVRLTKVGSETRLGQMTQLIQSSLHTKPHIVQLADRVAKPFLVIVLLLALLALVYWWPSDPQRAVLAAIAVLVVTCPCALALAAPAAFLSSASALAKSGLLVRDLSALERLKNVNHFAFDKTGTLTQTNLRVSSVEFKPGHTLSDTLAIAGVMAGNSMHPVSRALSSYINDAGVQPMSARVGALKETPGFGVSAEIGYANQPSSLHKLGSARFCGLKKDAKPTTQRAVYLSNEAGGLATFFLDETLRPDAATTVQEIKQAIQQQHPLATSQVSIMSGDVAPSVMRIATQLKWDHSVDKISVDCSAKEKLERLQSLQSQGYRVAMVGDGINDSPVLVAADVSFAPAQGAALASIKADFLLVSDSLAPIALAYSKAQQTMRIVRQNLGWALIYNFSCVPLALAGLLTPWMAGLGMATSSLLVLMNSLRLQRTRA